MTVYVLLAAVAVAAFALGHLSAGNSDFCSGLGRASPQHKEVDLMPAHLASPIPERLEKPPPSPPTPFYKPPEDTVFLQTARSVSPVTDKVTTHSYEALYSLHFEQVPSKQHEVLKILEIGLGCNMNYGPGASARLWRTYLPNAEVWFAEYDHNCVTAHQAKNQELGIKVLTGDQSDHATLQSWIQQSGGKFDAIIDDGGHANHHIYNSFQVLFHTALKPGGAYFIEDLQVSRNPGWRGTGPIMADVVRDWVDSVLRADKFVPFDEVLRNHQPPNITSQQPERHRLPPGAKSIKCCAESCVVVKCTNSDSRCPIGGGF